MQSVHLVAIALSVAVVPHSPYLMLSSLASLQWTEAAPPNGQSQPRVIDGSKDPELFPEWFIWEMLFESLPRTAPAKGDRKVSRYSLLGLTDSDIQTLVREVEVFERSKGILSEEIRTTRAALTASKKSESDIRDATHQLNLRYRYKILDARSRIYQDLSSGGAEKLRELAYQLVAGTKVHLRGRAAELFFTPW